MKNQQLSSIQELIRKGELAHARTLIRAWLRKKPKDRGVRLRLAYFARQAYLPERAIELLFHVVRTRVAGKGASDEERAEYGMALADMGAGYQLDLGTDRNSRLRG